MATLLSSSSSKLSMAALFLCLSQDFHPLLLIIPWLHSSLPPLPSFPWLHSSFPPLPNYTLAHFQDFHDCTLSHLFLPILSLEPSPKLSIATIHYICSTLFLFFPFHSFQALHSYMKLALQSILILSNNLRG